MRAGLLDTVVVFTQGVHELSAFGSGKKRWKEVLRTRARVQAEKGALTANVDEPFYEQRLTLTLRIYHKISPEWRVLLYNREWQQSEPPFPDKKMQMQTIHLIPVNN